jgi:hypothetical protein
MQTISHSQRSLLVFCLPLLIVACASDPAPVAPKAEPIISGDVMQRESEGIAKLSDRWKSGKDMVDSGTAMVNEGHAKISEGNRMIDEGNKIIRESEEHYKSIKK